MQRFLRSKFHAMIRLKNEKKRGAGYFLRLVLQSRKFHDYILFRKWSIQIDTSFVLTKRGAR